jgi:chromosome segregation ATPase
MIEYAWLALVLIALALCGLAWSLDHRRMNRRLHALRHDLASARAAAAQYAVDVRRDMLRLEKEMNQLRPLQIELEHARQELHRLQDVNEMLEAEAHSPHAPHSKIPAPESASIVRVSGFPDTLPLR